MRYIDGQEYATVSEVAEAAGVSPQTVRLWENLGHITSRRSPGGHRLFDTHAVKLVVDRAAQMRRDERTNRTLLPAQPSVRSTEFAATGARIRAVREEHKLTQEDVARRAGVSRSLLSAVERGESGLSVEVFNRIAEALDIPTSDLAPVNPGVRAMTRATERPLTVLDGGVTWEELASSGHSMAPALLLVEPGGSSGGVVHLSRENFVTVLEGELTVDVGPPDGKYVLGPGDSLMLASGQTHSWANTGQTMMRAIWVDQLKS